MLLLAFTGIGFPLSGAGEELLIHVCTISITQACEEAELQPSGRDLDIGGDWFALVTLSVVFQHLQRN